MTDFGWGVLDLVSTMRCWYRIYSSIVERVFNLSRTHANPKGALHPEVGRLYAHLIDRPGEWGSKLRPAQFVPGEGEQVDRKIGEDRAAFGQPGDSE